MFQHHDHPSISLKTHLHWFMLSFLSGGVNAGGFLSTQRFVSHVTGFATLFGIEAGRGDWIGALAMLSVPGFFLAGVIISGLLVERPFRRGMRPHYAVVMSLVFFCLLTAAIGGHYHWYGVWAERFNLREDYFLLALLCGASGLQNAAIATSSGATVRTTHLTGITTDLGLGLVRAFTLSKNRIHFLAEMKAARLRLGTIASFALGSAVSAALFFKYQYLGFLLPASIALYAYWVALQTYQNEPLTPKCETEILN